MIDVALLGIIRRWHLRDQVRLREIARRLGISRNTVRRYLRSETKEPFYAERRSSSLLDKYSMPLQAWLKDEPNKQRRNLKLLHLELKAPGYEGSYDRVAAFARQWKVGQSEWVNSASKRKPRGLPRYWAAVWSTATAVALADSTRLKKLRYLDSLYQRADELHDCGTLGGALASLDDRSLSPKLLNP